MFLINSNLGVRCKKTCEYRLRVSMSKNNWNSIKPYGLEKMALFLQCATHDTKSTVHVFRVKESNPNSICNAWPILPRSTLPRVRNHRLWVQLLYFTIAEVFLHKMHYLEKNIVSRVEQSKYFRCYLRETSIAENIWLINA